MSCPRTRRSARKTLTKENVQWNQKSQWRQKSHLGIVWESMQRALSYTRPLIGGRHRKFTRRLDVVERRGVLPRRGAIGRLEVTASNDSYAA